MGRPGDYSWRQRQGRKVPQVHRLGPFVMLRAYPKISCLLHSQTQALPWELSGSRHSTSSRCCTPPPTRPANPQRTHMQDQTIPFVAFHAPFNFCVCVRACVCVCGKWEGNAEASLCVSKKKTKKYTIALIYIYLCPFFHLQLTVKNLKVKSNKSRLPFALKNNQQFK